MLKEYSGHDIDLVGSTFQDIFSKTFQKLDQYYFDEISKMADHYKELFFETFNFNKENWEEMFHLNIYN